MEKEGVVVDPCWGFKKEGTLINHKPNNYDSNSKAQFFKYVVKAMLAIGMNSMPPKVIGENVYLQARGLYELSKDLSHAQKKQYYKIF